MNLIRSIGLYWDPANVFWGAGSQAGGLLGVPSTNTTSEPVDFRDQVGIYVLYDGYKIVYVGQTGRGNQKLLVRLKQHWYRMPEGRWNKFSWFGIRWVRKAGGLSAIVKARHPSLTAVLDHMEALVIQTTEAPLNRQGGRFGGEVTWYYQSRDKRLPPTTADMIQELWSKSRAG